MAMGGDVDSGSGSRGSCCIKGTDESTLVTDSLDILDAPLIEWSWIIDPDRSWSLQRNAPSLYNGFLSVHAFHYLLARLTEVWLEIIFFGSGTVDCGLLWLSFEGYCFDGSFTAGIADQYGKHFLFFPVAELYNRFYMCLSRMTHIKFLLFSRCHGLVR